VGEDVDTAGEEINVVKALFVYYFSVMNSSSLVVHVDHYQLVWLVFKQIQRSENLVFVYIHSGEADGVTNVADGMLLSFP